MKYILFLGYGLILMLIAELFGRGKHIGRWWTFALLACTPVLPGLIALLSSPHAMNHPTKANKITKFIGVLLVFLGIIGIVPAIPLGPLGFVFPLMLCVFGSYLIMLGKGSITNSNPKYYFNSQVPLGKRFVMAVTEIKTVTAIVAVLGAVTILVFFAVMIRSNSNEFVSSPAGFHSVQSESSISDLAPSDLASADSNQESSLSEIAPGEVVRIDQTTPGTVATAETLPKNYFLSDDQTALYFFDEKERHWWFIPTPPTLLNGTMIVPPFTENDRNYKRWHIRENRWLINDNEESVAEQNAKFNKNGTHYKRKVRKGAKFDFP
jgi:hypothetical protein